MVAKSCRTVSRNIEALPESPARRIGALFDQLVGEDGVKRHDYPILGSHYSLVPYARRNRKPPSIQCDIRPTDQRVRNPFPILLSLQIS